MVTFVLSELPKSSDSSFSAGTWTHLLWQKHTRDRFDFCCSVLNFKSFLTFSTTCLEVGGRGGTGGRKGESDEQDAAWLKLSRCCVNPICKIRSLCNIPDCVGIIHKDIVKSNQESGVRSLTDCVVIEIPCQHERWYQTSKMPHGAVSTSVYCSTCRRTRVFHKNSLLPALKFKEEEEAVFFSCLFPAG